ncbi:hypothetical protein M408DRAFT_333343 [Serendipita vermifera MAFF 305830]|uniref:Uncharacterized protein n=1 Tax=Serendipita vermifera MAFF 305830 TaxID=933852 RepID=A0A0C3AQW4_SERVB|nr:hypothetical protein M408DRAFT_333343 [Serendipita vermifera MAFF 305830]
MYLLTGTTVADVGIVDAGDVTDFGRLSIRALTVASTRLCALLRLLANLLSASTRNLLSASY